MRRAAPAFFVVLWSTGFIVARYATRDASPLSFLTLRMVVAAAVLWAVARVLREERVGRSRAPVQVLVGIGMHAMYLGGVFVAIDRGLPAGLSALIAGLHPVATAVAGRVVLGERLGTRRTVGTMIGLAGVVAVVVDRGLGDGVDGWALVAMGVAVVGMSAGTLLQRRRAVGTPLLGGTAWQYGATAVALGVPAVAVEGWHVEATARMFLSLVWSVGVLSVAAVLTMLWLLQRRAAASVSSLFFLTPALSAAGAAVLFDERLGAWSVAGLVTALVGVWLAADRTPTRSADPAAQVPS